MGLLYFYKKVNDLKKVQWIVAIFSGGIGQYLIYKAISNFLDGKKFDRKNIISTLIGMGLIDNLIGIIKSKVRYLSGVQLFGLENP